MKKEALKTAMLFLLIALAVSVAVFVIYIRFSPIDKPTGQVSTEPLPIIVIDVGYDGTLEKELNLQIANVLAELFRASGYNVVMTRTSDEMLTADDNVGSNKLQDLKKRLTVASSYPDSVTVSLHCNKFPAESCKGLQVYYSDSDTARTLAESIQSSVTGMIQPENHRKVKKADSSIYLLDRAKTPSVLIECGFLSNTEECEKLKDGDYQKKLALAIFTGITAVY